MSISEQFRNRVGLEGDPDPALGLENAKGKSGGEPVDVDADFEAEAETESKPKKKPAKKTAKKTATKKKT